MTNCNYRSIIFWDAISPLSSPFLPDWSSIIYHMQIPCCRYNVPLILETLIHLYVNMLLLNNFVYLYPALYIFLPNSLLFAPFILWNKAFNTKISSGILLYHPEFLYLNFMYKPVFKQIIDSPSVRSTDSQVLFFLWEKNCDNYYIYMCNDAG